VTPKDAPSCDDCYFRRGGLCAMRPERICPTFRPGTLRLMPQPAQRLVPLAVVAAGNVA
jgi:hypothetical protein